MDNGVELYQTSKLTVVLHLQYRGIKPIKRTVDDDGRAILHYVRDYKLNEELAAHMTPCETCGVSFEGMEAAYANAKRMLLDGDLGAGRKENGDERGGAR